MAMTRAAGRHLESIVPRSPDISGWLFAAGTEGTAHDDPNGRLLRHPSRVRADFESLHQQAKRRQINNTPD